MSETTCGFDEAWCRPCEAATPCARHSGLKCCSCGAPAVRECPETFGMVCGAPLCGGCEHEIAEDGTNGANLRHCRKGDQKYRPWHMRAEATGQGARP